jgi:hypothetical protein
MAKRGRWAGTRTITNHITPIAVVRDGIRFDSEAEGNRYAALKLRTMTRGPLQIRNLEVHPRLSLEVVGLKTGKLNKVGRGYIVLDFKYEEQRDGAWRVVYEDYKGGNITRESKTRLNLCEALHEIQIKIT